MMYFNPIFRCCHNSTLNHGLLLHAGFHIVGGGGKLPPQKKGESLSTRPNTRLLLEDDCLSYHKSIHCFWYMWFLVLYTVHNYNQHTKLHGVANRHQQQGVVTRSWRGLQTFTLACAVFPPKLKILDETLTWYRAKSVISQISGTI